MDQFNMNQFKINKDELDNDIDNYKEIIKYESKGKGLLVMLVVVLLFIDFIALYINISTGVAFVLFQLAINICVIKRDHKSNKEDFKDVELNYEFIGKANYKITGKYHSIVSGEKVIYLEDKNGVVSNYVEHVDSFMNEMDYTGERLVYRNCKTGKLLALPRGYKECWLKNCAKDMQAKSKEEEINKIKNLCLFH